MALFVCIKQFNARLGDELSLKVGDKVEVLADDSEYNDGWYMGKSLLTGDVGLYPKSFTQPLADDAAAKPMRNRSRKLDTVAAKLAEVQLDDGAFAQETMSPNGDVDAQPGSRPGSQPHSFGSASFGSHSPSDGLRGSSDGLRGPSDGLRSSETRGPDHRSSAPLSAPPVHGTPSSSYSTASSATTPVQPVPHGLTPPVIPKTRPPGSGSASPVPPSGFVSPPSAYAHASGHASGHPSQTAGHTAGHTSHPSGHPSHTAGHPSHPAGHTSHTQAPDVLEWSPAQVSAYFRQLNFDADIASRFEHHEISGPILLELDLSHLKELDIDSFGTRFQIYKEIEKLKSPAVARKPSVSRGNSTRLRQKDSKSTITDATSPRPSSPVPPEAVPRAASAPNPFQTPKHQQSSYSQHPSRSGSGYASSGFSSGSARRRSQMEVHAPMGPHKAPVLNGTAADAAYPVSYKPSVAAHGPSHPSGLGLASHHSSAPTFSSSNGSQTSHPPESRKPSEPASALSANTTVSSDAPERSVSNVSAHSAASHQRPYSTMEPVDRATSMFSFASSDDQLARMPKSNATVAAVAAAAAATAMPVASPEGDTTTASTAMASTSAPASALTSTDRAITPEYRLSRARDPDAPTPPPKDRSSVYRPRQKKAATDTSMRHSMYQDTRVAASVDTLASTRTVGPVLASSGPSGTPSGPGLPSGSSQAAPPVSSTGPKGPTKLTSPAKVKRSSSLFSPKQRKHTELPELDTIADDGTSPRKSASISGPSVAVEPRSPQSPRSPLAPKSPVSPGDEKMSRLKTLRTTSTANFMSLGGKKQKTSAFQEGIQEVEPEESAKTAAFSGWMSKRSGNTLSWRSRFFVLHGTRLSYFTSLKDRREKGLIDITAHKVMPLNGDKRSTDDESGNNDKYIALYAASTGYGRYCFKIVPPAPGFKKGLTFTQPKVHYFAVDTQEEMRGWLKALMAATIDIDDSVPVVSSCVTPTVSLAKAQELLAKAREETRLKDEELRAKGFIREYDDSDPAAAAAAADTAASDYTQFLHDHSFDLPGSPFNDSNDDTTLSSVGGPTGLSSVAGSVSRSKADDKLARSSSLASGAADGRSPRTPQVSGGGFTSPYLLASGLLSPKGDARPDYFGDLGTSPSTTNDSPSDPTVDSTPQSTTNSTNRNSSIPSKVLSYSSDAAGNLTFQLKQKK
ncbi:BEM1-interacting protein 2 [Diutina catenulata]